MNKRLLALLLVLCTVLLSVPVFALPVAAVEEIVYEYETSFNSTTNMPYFDGTLTNNTTKLTTTGNWAPMSYLKSNGYSDPSKAYPMDIYNNNLITNATAAFSSAWPGGVITGWAQKSSLMVDTKGNQPDYWITKGQFNVTDEMSAGMRYTAEKTGIVDIIFDELGNYATAADCVGLSNFRYGIFVNGAMVWPVEGGTLSATAALTENKTNLIAVTGLSIKAGDIIEFICEVETEAHNWTGAGNVMFPTIGYTAVTATSFNSTTNLPTIEGGSVVTHGNWQPMAYIKGLNNKAYVMARTAHPSFGSTTTITFDDWPGATYIPGWAQKGGMMLANPNNVQPGYFNTPGQLNVTDECSAGIRYTVEKTGTIEIVFDKLGNYNEGGDPNGVPLGLENFRYGIFVNGVMEWPVKGGTLSATDALTENKTDLTAVTGLTVNKGDIIDFICEAQIECAQWPGACNVMFPTITYTEFEVAYKYSTSFNTSKLPSIDGTYPDAAWGIYDYAKRDFGVEENAKLVNAASGHGGVWATGGLSADYPTTDAGAPVWADRTHVVLNNFHANFFNENGQIALGDTTTAAVRYTAEKNGVIDITIDRLANTAPSSNATFTYSVMVNGESLWSTQITAVSGTTYGNVVTDFTMDALKDIQVSKGDFVEFTIESTGGDIWAGCGNIFFGTVNYSKVIAAPTATANVAVGTTLSSTASVVLPDGAVATESGLYIDGVKTPGASAAILENIAIKDIEAETVTVQPYYVENGFEAKGEETTHSIATLLARYQGNAVASAVLNYAGAAQDYFGIEGTLSYTETTVGDYSDKVATVTNTLEGATANPTKLALILNATASAQIKVVVPNAPAGAQLKVFANGNTDYVDLVVAEDGETYFMMNAIGVEYWNEQFELTVVDSEGAAISSTFTYGVSTYYNRMMAKDTDAALANLITAMMALYEAL